MMLLCFAYATTIGPILNFKSIVSSIVFHSSYTTTIQLRDRQHNCEADNVRNRRPSIYNIIASFSRFVFSFFLYSSDLCPTFHLPQQPQQHHHSNTTTTATPSQQHHHNNTSTNDNTNEKNNDHNDNNTNDTNDDINNDINTPTTTSTTSTTSTTTTTTTMTTPFMREMSGLNARPRQRVLPTFASRGTQTPPPRRAQPAGPPAGPSAGPSSGPPGAAAPGAAHASAPLSDGMYTYLSRQQPYKMANS